MSLMNFDTTQNGPSTLNEAFNGQGKNAAMMDNEEARFQRIFTEACLVDEILRLPENKFKQLTESGALQALVEAGKMRKKTIVRIGQKDDLERRTMLACIERAREAGDRLWSLLRLNRIKERALLEQIRKKYENKGKRDAVASQKNYIKNVLPTRQQLFTNPNNIK